MDAPSPVPGINIFSGEVGLGAALTNPTELARQKGKLAHAYPVTVLGRRFPDAESAYKQLRSDSPIANDALMAELIAAKLRQHPRLLEAISRRGGVPWLECCSHWTGATSEHAKAWEGSGRESRFIRNLIAGYELASADLRTEKGQLLLY